MALGVEVYNRSFKCTVTKIDWNKRWWSVNMRDFSLVFIQIKYVFLPVYEKLKWIVQQNKKKKKVKID